MITFPTTTEAFIAYQEAGTDRKLKGREREQAERAAQVAALRDHSDSTPEQKLEAVKLLLELERERYSY